jgi:divalent metal cation (Fe/Co/Zn/Cd) transporter
MDNSLYRKALVLSYLTVSYNIVEAGVALFLGIEAGSPALLGFGLDSVVESISGGIMIWRFMPRSDDAINAHQKRELRAITLVGYSFFLLSAITIYESVTGLLWNQHPEQSLFGIVIACVSLVVMPLLFFAKRDVGRNIGSQSLQADARQTLACWSLSLALLVGLMANGLYGIWWADPAAGVIIGAYLLKEGITTLKHRQLCAC